MSKRSPTNQVRRWRLALSFVQLAVGAALLIGGASTAGEPVGLAGPARVVDGDTLQIAGATVRLVGIDAPEGAQQCQAANGSLYRCGDPAQARLQALVGGRSVVCAGSEQDRYGRLLAACSVDGADLGAAMVSAGWALAFRRYSERYVAQEADARRARRGLWAGAFLPPWDWRQGSRLPAEQPASRPDAPAARIEAGGCRIKGNISTRSGERIYHVPGGAYYDRTRIDLGKGERCFDTEAQARAAGWRRSKR